MEINAINEGYFNENFSCSSPFIKKRSSNGKKINSGRNPSENASIITSGLNMYKSDPKSAATAPFLEDESYRYLIRKYIVMPGSIKCKTTQSLWLLTNAKPSFAK